MGLTTNWKEAGLHYSGEASKCSNSLLTEWKPEYDYLPDKPVKIDIDGKARMP